MRWNSTLTLIGHSEPVQDDMGTWTEGEPVSREVFCNEFTVSGTTWGTALEAGLRADAQVQIHAADYRDEQEAVYNGIEYTIERIQAKGDFVRLQLGRKVSNERNT